MDLARHQPRRWSALAAALVTGVVVLVSGDGVRARAPQVPQKPPASTPASPLAVSSTQPPPARGADPRQDWMWWQDDSVKKEIGLTDEQVRHISRIYDERQKAVQPFAEEYSKQLAELDRMVRARVVDETTVALQAARVEAPHARLNESRIVMLYRIFRVLSVEQNQKMEVIRDRRMHGRGFPLPAANHDRLERW
jgi:Spy/CpxP family protein refolding chaperone